MAYSQLTNTAVGVYSDYYLRLYWEETVNITANTSTVNVRLYGYTTRSRENSAYNNFGKNSISITINGNTNTLNNQNIDTRDWINSEKLLHSHSVTVTHDNDGTKSIAISGVINYQGGGTSLIANNNPGQLTTSVASQALTKIARASTIGTSSGTTITSTSGNLRVNITKQNSAYYDRITVTGAISGTYNAGTNTYVDIPWSTLLGGISTKSGVIKVTVNTYSNSGYTTLVGSNGPKQISVTVDIDKIKPSISWTSQISVNTNGLSSKLVAGRSTAKATWSVSNATGATVSSVKITTTKGAITSSTASSTSTSGTPITETLPSSASDYTFTMTAVVTDSRGATASITTNAATVYGYSTPNLTLSAYRTASNSSTTANPTGAYVYITWSSSVGASVGGSNTIASTTTSPSGLTNNSWRSLATNATLEVVVTVKDTIGNETSKKVNIGTSLIPFDLYSNAAGTSVGVGFGRMAEAGTVKSSMSIYTDGSLFTGGKTVWNSTTHGVYIGSDGTMHLAHDTEPYIGFHYGNQQSASAAITAQSGGVLNLTGSSIRVNGSEISTAANTVKTTGDQTIGGTKTFSAVPAVKANWPGLDFKTSIGTTMTIIANSGTTNGKYRADRFYFRHYSYNSSSGDRTEHYYQYRLPAVPAGLSTDATYEILTSQSAVAVEHGGTGATTPANARSNLGVNQPASLASVSIAGNATGTLSITTANYKFYLFKFTCNSRITTIFTTYSQLSTSAQTYWIYDGSSSGAEVIITRTASSITVKRDGSTACSVVLTYWN